MTLNELANQGNLQWLGKLHFICAVLNNEQDLFLTQTGAAQAYLCRNGQLSSITKRLVPQPEKAHPSKTFQSVISGKIEAEDKLILATPALFECFSPPGLKQIFEIPRIENISDHISKALREIKRTSAMSALLMEIAPDEIIASNQEENVRHTTPPINLSEIIDD